MTCIIIICALITEWHPVSASYYDYGNVDFDVFVQHIPSQKIRRLYLSFYSEPPLPLESEQLLKLMLTAARNVYPDEDIMAKAHYHPNGREADGELLYMEDGSTALWYIASDEEIVTDNEKRATLSSTPKGRQKSEILKPREKGITIKYEKLDPYRRSR